MNIIIGIIYVFAILVIVLSFVNLKLSTALYISYLILVPYLDLTIAGVELSYNLVNSVLLFTFLYHFYNLKKDNHLDFSINKPFFFLFFALFFLSLFAYETPYEVQFNSLRLSFMKTCILPFIIWNYFLSDPDIIPYVKRALIISFCIAGIYGLLLTRLQGVNPYTSFLATYFGDKNDVADIYSTAQESRLSFSSAGKIQSTMIHPMLWGIHLCFMAIVAGVYFFKEKKIWYLGFLALIAFNILISGVRTGLAAMMIGAFYFLLRIRQTKIIIPAAVVMALLFFVISANDDLGKVFASFTDVSGKNSDVNGSTIGMRMDQLQGAFNEIKGKEWVGKGYGWTAYYQSLHGDHPVLLAFESLIFVVLCNSGLLGVVIWVIFIFLLFKLQRRIFTNREDIAFMDSVVITYLVYAIGTGEYGYLQVFSMYYTFIVCAILMFNSKTLQQNNVYG